jgi:biotin-(acetyl-CoA carboxylase) ligase
VKLPGGQVDQGIALGVAEDGALLFQSGAAVRRLHSGEISVRDARNPPPASARSRA